MRSKLIAIKNMYNEIIDLVDDFTGESLAADVSGWLIDTALRIWAANDGFSVFYPIVLRHLTDIDYTADDVVATMEVVQADVPDVDCPHFIINCLDALSADTADDFSHIVSDIMTFCVSVAWINGDLTEDEAAVLKSVDEQIAEMVKSYGVNYNSDVEEHIEITPRNDNAYMDPNQCNELYITATEYVINKNAVEEYENGSDSSEETAAATEPEETLEDVLDELNSLVGLDEIKKDIRSMMNFIRIGQLRKQRGMDNPTISYHLVFTGNPGTGKTTVARLVARLYHLLGILPKGQLIETDRSGLVAGYVGQTAIKTQKVIEEAMGGVLFIDEAYSLVNDDDDSFGQEAIDTILKAMEDHRDEFVVIVAGYDGLMQEFIDSNPGLRSRFSRYYNFADYDGEELMQIFNSFCEKNSYKLSDDAGTELQNILNELYARREEHFGNARMIRNLFEHAIANLADRLVYDPDITDEELMTITSEDIHVNG